MRNGIENQGFCEATATLQPLCADKIPAELGLTIWDLQAGCDDKFGLCGNVLVSLQGISSQNSHEVHGFAERMVEVGCEQIFDLFERSIETEHDLSLARACNGTVDGLDFREELCEGAGEVIGSGSEFNVSGPKGRVNDDFLEGLTLNTQDLRSKEKRGRKEFMNHVIV